VREILARDASPGNLIFREDFLDTQPKQLIKPDKDGGDNTGPFHPTFLFTHANPNAGAMAQVVALKRQSHFSTMDQAIHKEN
jgi:hypothetical protein